MLKHPVATRAGERGSVVVAISALMLLLLIGTALVARSQAELGAAGASTDAEAAQAAAEQGVVEVLALLEAGTTGGFGGDGEVGDGKYKYEAKQISETEYVVQAQGYVGERVRAVEVIIGGSVTAPFSLFVDYKTTIGDNTGTVEGRIGTNGGIEISGTEIKDTVELYGRDANCRACGATRVFEDQLDLPEPTVPEGKTQSCPSDGVFTGAIDGAAGTPFYCLASDIRSGLVTFTDTVTVKNPPLIIYVQSGLDIKISSASINKGGEMDDFQLFAEGGPDDFYWDMNVFNSNVHGRFYMPGRVSRFESSAVYGSLTVGVLQVDSPGEFWLAPSPSTATSTVNGWTVTAWESIPPW